MKYKDSKFENISKKIISYMAAVLFKLQAVISLIFGAYLGKRSVFEQSFGDAIFLVVFGLMLILLINIFYVSTRLPNKKRFTYTDEMGNKCIRSEDLPQIIDYLYEQEELHGNR